MESSKFLCKIDPHDVKLKSGKQSVYFKQPRLVAYYEKDYDSVEPGEKIFYFKRPEPQKYPIDLNLGYDTFTEKKESQYVSLSCCLKYIMTPESEINFENIDKIKIFTRRRCLVDLMEIYYQKRYLSLKIHVTRYNEDLYISREKDSEIVNSVLNPTNEGINLEPRHTHDGQFLKNVFTGK